MTIGAEADKVLTTDASGVATWQEAAGGSGTVTNFVFTNSTGITGTVATPTITPTLSLALTSAAVGLGNVNNTADSAKSVFYAVTAGSAPKGTLTCTTYTCSFLSGSSYSCTVTCPAGTVCTGGGANGASTNFSVVDNLPTDNGWNCHQHSNTQTTVTCYARCCKIQ